MATHSSILAWEISWIEEPGRLQSVGSQRVRHNWAASTLTGCWPCKGTWPPPVTLFLWDILLWTPNHKWLLECSSVQRPWTAFTFLNLFEFQEREDHPRRGREDRPHREPTGQEHKRARNSDRDRHRSHSHQRRSSGERPGSGQPQGRDRDAQNLQAQEAEREFHNARRREHRQKNEVSAGSNASQDALPRPGPGGNSKDKEVPVKEKPSFELSGALLEDTNTFRGVVIKYSEPPEARIPKKRWRLYPFKNDEVLPVMYIHRQSAYLLGRHRRIADIPIDHPSCSKQHAVFQYR